MCQYILFIGFYLFLNPPAYAIVLSKTQGPDKEKRISVAPIIQVGDILKISI